jgi:stringent starvation protein B
MAEPPKLPPKKAVAEALLRGSSMFVHLDPRREGVLVPAWFKRQPQLVLQLGLNMAVPIRDLAVTEQGVSGTLSFNRSPFWCNVPWGAVYALVGEDGRGMVWPADVPPEQPLQGRRPAGGGTAMPAPADASSQARPKLRIAPAAPTEPATPTAPSSAAPAAAPPLAADRGGAVSGDGGSEPAVPVPPEPSPTGAPKRSRRKAAESPAAPKRPRKGAAEPTTTARRPRRKAAGPQAAPPLPGADDGSVPAATKGRGRRPPKGGRARAVGAPTQAELPLAVEAPPPATAEQTAARAPSAPPTSAEPTAPGDPVDAASDSLEAMAAEPKPRRTLPPYLRVIK